MNWTAVFGPDAWVPLLNGGVRLAMPIALAASGLAYVQRAGLLNLSVDGVMMMGALGSFLGAYATGSPWIGIAAGIAAGMLISMSEALLVVTLRLPQVVSGIALFILGHGLAVFLYRMIFGVTSSPPTIDGLGVVSIPVLSSIPWIGPVLFAQNPVVYLGLALAVVVWWLLEKTTVGLAARASGELPRALYASGGSVAATRWLAFAISGAMAGLAGAILVVTELKIFGPNLTAGRGWIALALVIFARWKPLWVVAGALLFGVIDSFQLRIQSASGGISSEVPYEFFQALPYLVTILAMWLSAARADRSYWPTALGDPYRKEDQHS